MTNESKLPVNLISIIPNIIGGEGHIIPYHIAVNKATKILNWQHKIAYSSDSNNQKIEHLPNNWNDTLRGANLEKSATLLGQFLKIIDVLIFTKSLINYLKKEGLQKVGKNVIFIERFIHLQLFSLWLATLFIPKKDLYIWVLYRVDIHNHKTRIIYKLINKLLKNRVNSDQFRLLTDSELLSKSLSNYFEEKVTVMPIPHTELIDSKNDHKNDYILCWWAGPPREEKGLKVIQNLVKYQSKEAQKFCLVVAKSSQLKVVENGIKINLIEDNINRIQYLQWLEKADLILLPYDAQAYKERTSGIFTESIIAGKIMLVTANSWMAEELAKYDLNDLVIDWEKMDNIFAYFQQIVNTPQIKEKILIMQQKYIAFHNEHNYAMTMNELI